MLEVKFLDDPIEADAQLYLWGLDRAKLIESVLYGRSFYVECTANDPRGFAGAIAYARTGRRLRDLFAGQDGWSKDEINNQTAIRNDSLKLRLYPCNFDSRTASKRTPCNLTDKGNAAQEDTEHNAQLSLFDMPEMLSDIEEINDAYQTLLLGMNFESEFAKAEVSLPVTFSRKRFTGLAIRVPLLDGLSPDKGPQTKYKPDDSFGEVDIQIGRKKS